MKHIIVTKCGECPFYGYKHDNFFCMKIAEAHQNEVKKNTIHKDCPLREMPSREEAVTTITVSLMCTGRNPNDSNDIANELVDLLGFKD
jgi:hypothetical protein